MTAVRPDDLEVELAAWRSKLAIAAECWAMARREGLSTAIYDRDMREAERRIRRLQRRIRRRR